MLTFSVFHSMNRYNSRKKSSISKTFKDYLVPIIGFALIILIVYTFFSWGSSTTNTASNENRVGSQLTLEGVNPEVYIVYTGEKQEQVKSAQEIFKGEKVIIKEWGAHITTTEQINIDIDRLWEFKLNEDGSFALYSSNIWIDSPISSSINLRYATVKISENSVLSLTQNEVSSTIYVLKGNAEVSNLLWNSTLVGKGQKITISRSDANEDIDLTSAKENLDSFFLASEWFIKNKGEILLQSNDTPTTGSGETSTWVTSTIVTKTNIIRFTNVKDEDNVTTDSTTLEGDINSDWVFLISADDIQADINIEEKTFKILNVNTKQKENDIVIKVYNESREIIQKSVLTLYNGGSAVAETNTPFTVENYSLDSTEFQFISPKQNPYTTTEWVVMIEGRVPGSVVQKILINGYQLQKFPQYGTYWSYFANQEFGNLKEGLNIYKVDYYDKNGSILHSNAFTIVKSKVEAPAVIPSSTTNETQGGA